MINYTVIISVYIFLLELFLVQCDIHDFSILRVLMIATFCALFAKLIYFLPVLARKVANMLFIVLGFFLSFGNVFFYMIKGEFFTVSQLSLIDELAGVGDTVGGYFQWTFLIFLLIPIAFIGLTNVVLNNNIQKYPNFIVGVLIGLLLLTNIGFYTQDSLLYTTVYSPVDYVKTFGFISFYTRDLLPFTKVNLDNLEYDNTVESLPNNEHTGQFEEKSNVIYITAESLDDIAIDEKLTPTLYKMANDGLLFENYYTLSNNTNASEFSSLTSVHPPIDNSKIEKFSGNYNSIPELFNQAGYCTTGFHLNSGTFYNRKETFDTLYHFANSYFTEELKEGIDNNKIQDEYLFELSTQFLELQECDKNFTYYMSIFGHSAYDIEDRPREEKNYEYVQSVYPDNDEYLNAYLTFQMSLDRMLEEMVAYYSETGLLDETLFIIVGDHYPYALGDPEHPYGEYSTDFMEQSFSGEAFETYNVPFLIYDPTQKLENNNEFMSNIDILPTIADLMNFDYEYAEGKSAFDNSKPGVIKWLGSNDFSVLSEEVTYNGSVDNPSSVQLSDEIDSDKEFAAKLYSMFN